MTIAPQIPAPSDEKGFGGSIPLAKALAPETLLAYGMNGAPLPPLHGGPLRLLVPGYIGARSVKWLGHLTLAASPSQNHYQARSYRVFPPEIDARNVNWDEGESLGPLWVNAVICQPAPGEKVAAGPLPVAGLRAKPPAHRCSGTLRRRRPILAGR